MRIIAKCKTQTEAVKLATAEAIESAVAKETEWTEKVLMACGDTLYITADENGKTTKKVSSGWDCSDGYLWCGPKSASVII